MFDKLPCNRIHADVPGEGHRPLDWVPSGLETGMDRIVYAVLAACHAGREDVLYVALDATHGANVQAVASRLADRLEQEQIRAHVYSTEDYLYGGSELRRRFDRYITGNRAFGYMASDVSFMDYFRPDAAACWAAEAKQDTAAHPGAKQVMLLCGPGALWLGGERIGLSFYCDVS